ncbi:hypothetical protein CAJAP_07461 [Camponotus japonicus]
MERKIIRLQVYVINLYIIYKSIEDQIQKIQIQYLHPHQILVVLRDQILIVLRDQKRVKGTCSGNEIDLDLHNLMNRKLNTILLNLVTIDERLIRLENLIVSRTEFTAATTENKNYDLPVYTMEELQRIDCQLQDKCVAAEMVYMLRVKSAIF